jgi:hypothetical protein
MDVGATNRRVAVTGIAIWRIGGGKMLEEWITEDLLGMMQQLGAIPAPGHDP